MLRKPRVISLLATRNTRRSGTVTVSTESYYEDAFQNTSDQCQASQPFT